MRSIDIRPNDVVSQQSLTKPLRTGPVRQPRLLLLKSSLSYTTKLRLCLLIFINCSWKGRTNLFVDQVRQRRVAHQHPPPGVKVTKLFFIVTDILDQKLSVAPFGETFQPSLVFEGRSKEA